MQTKLFSQTDLEQINSKGMTLLEIEQQISNFEKGFPYLELVNTATVEKGIIQIPPKDENKYIQYWENYLNSDRQIVKFVPASGAASRMFKDLFEYMESKDDTIKETIIIFFDNINKFAFFNDLNKACIEMYHQDISQLISEGKHKFILRALLNKECLNYGNLPKGLLKFHKYNNTERTPIEEHLVEGSLYAKNNHGIVNLHFTVSPEHKNLFKQIIDQKVKNYEDELSCQFNIEFSQQKAKTDTIAVDLNNKPFRENEHLVFRPGGHGALLENLNDINADIIFLKNIDNVVLDKHKGIDLIHKKILAGYLVKTQEEIHKYLKILDSGTYDRDKLLEILHFLQNQLNTKNKETKYLEDAELVIYLKNKLNRPIRVCGMVKNIGEPGGGPFFATNTDNTTSLQILESSQIDLSNSLYVKMFENGTHFNPVDIVCGIKDYNKEKFNLKLFIDEDTGFISKKSKNGKELKALELPGLWNGSMSNWNTIFIEVPIKTFNPVKTVNDLLRPEHQ